jgi:D-glycero-D-manno-heptose 1,7-bisphosphate phosphatase
MLRILFTEPLALAAEPTAAKKGPAIFIDRDGVINCRRPDDYVLDWSQFVFVDGIRSALKQLATLCLPMIVISNQAAVGKGLLDVSRLEEITGRMQQALLADGAPLIAAYYCIHRRDEGCSCRKPKPGLLQKAAADFHIELPQSIFIGDSDSDVQAARAAGCQPVLFGPGVADASSTSSSGKGPPSLAQALTAGELFAVAAKCLRGDA